MTGQQYFDSAATTSLAPDRCESDVAHVATLKRHFIDRLGARWPSRIHGHPEQSSSYILNLSLDGICSDAFINQISGQLAIASGSVCSSGAIESAHVLHAIGIGIEGEAPYGAVRVRFDRDQTPDQVSMAADLMVAAATRIQESTAS